jgi:hypothetical protein
MRAGGRTMSFTAWFTAIILGGYFVETYSALVGYSLMLAANWEVYYRWYGKERHEWKEDFNSRDSAVHANPSPDTKAAWGRYQRGRKDWKEWRETHEVVLDNWFKVFLLRLVLLGLGLAMLYAWLANRA